MRFYVNFVTKRKAQLIYMLGIFLPLREVNRTNVLDCSK